MKSKCPKHEIEEDKPLVVQKDTEMKATTDLFSEVMLIIPQGTRVQRILISGSYSFIEYRGKFGYVISANLSDVVEVGSNDTSRSTDLPDRDIDLVWRTILNENFFNNHNRWHIGSSEVRNANIVGGQLVDMYLEKGFAQINRINININPNIPYRIEFSLANLHGDHTKRYMVYEKQRNGLLKEDWVNNPNWGFVWGFKDWDNYNCIWLSSYSNGRTGIWVYSIENGNTTTHTRETTNQEFRLQSGSSKNVLSITSIGHNTLIINDLYNIPVSAVMNAKWYGNGIGIYIGAGAKVALDYLRVKVKKPHPKTSWNENSLINHWRTNSIDNIEGIYEAAIRSENGHRYKMAVKKTDEGYNLIYLSGADNSQAIQMGIEPWVIGDVKAYLTPTATISILRAKWFNQAKSSIEDVYIGFEGGSMKTIFSNQQDNLYIKLFPNISDNIAHNRTGVKTSGTGFALSTNGYVATNHHVIEGSNNIKIRGINGDSLQLFRQKFLLQTKTMI